MKNITHDLLKECETHLQERFGIRNATPLAVLKPGDMFDVKPKGGDGPSDAEETNVDCIAYAHADRSYMISKEKLMQELERDPELRDKISVPIARD